MKPYPKAELYASPISLPEARSGSFAVVHTKFLPENGPVAVLGVREALLTGRRSAAVQLREPLLVHQLIEYRDEVEAVWMSDEPQELRQAAEWLLGVKPRGRVLVGGLGLGVVASWLARLPLVDEVVVVEREQDVIDLVARHQPGYTVERADLFDYLRNLPRWTFDFAFFDIWQGTNEGTWWSHVLPLRRLVGQRFGRRKVACWAEDMMRGQVRRALECGNDSFLERTFALEGKKPPKGIARHWHYAPLPPEMSELEISHFIEAIGTQGWEKLWGRRLDNAARPVPLRQVVGG